MELSASPRAVCVSVRSRTPLGRWSLSCRQSLRRWSCGKAASAAPRSPAQGRASANSAARKQCCSETVLRALWLPTSTFSPSAQGSGGARPPQAAVNAVRSDLSVSGETDGPVIAEPMTSCGTSSPDLLQPGGRYRSRRYERGCCSNAAVRRNRTAVASPCVASFC